MRSAAHRSRTPRRRRSTRNRRGQSARARRARRRRRALQPRAAADADGVSTARAAARLEEGDSDAWMRVRRRAGRPAGGGARAARGRAASSRRSEVVATRYLRGNGKTQKKQSRADGSGDADPRRRWRATPRVRGRALRPRASRTRCKKETDTGRISGTNPFGRQRRQRRASPGRAFWPSSARRWGGRRRRGPRGARGGAATDSDDDSPPGLALTAPDGCRSKQGREG